LGTIIIQNPGSPPVPGITITDYEAGFDRIVVGSLVADPLAGAVEVGADVHIDFGVGRLLIISDRSIADLEPSDFFFGTPLVGNDNSNTLSGGAGNNVIAGHGGDDTIIGGLADDYMIGGDGNDVMSGGGGGNDVMLGGEGDDFLSFFTLSDNVGTGGRGADTFSFVDGVGTVITNPGPGSVYITTAITDFEPGVDAIEFAVNPFDVVDAAMQQGDDVFIAYLGEQAILLLDTRISDLSNDDFHFVDPPGPPEPPEPPEPPGPNPGLGDEI
jgi:Ca2+-binding RTX toxin-like protein